MAKKTPRELAAPTAPRTWCNAEPRNDYARARDDRYRRIQGNRAPEAWVESVGERERQSARADGSAG